jgi:hypothetical protein
MRIAGVRLDSGRLVWVDAGDLEVQPLDEAAVDLAGVSVDGHIAVVPEALVRPVPPEGRLVESHTSHITTDTCAELPGAAMPPLGTNYAGGTVVSVDSLNGTATVRLSDGDLQVVAAGQNSGKTTESADTAPAPRP